MVTQADMPAIAAMRKKNGTGSLGGADAPAEESAAPADPALVDPLIDKKPEPEAQGSLAKLNKIAALYSGGLGTM